MVNLAGAIEGPPIFKSIEEPVLAKFKDKLDTSDNFKKSYDAAIGFLDTAIVDNKTKSPPDKLLQDIDTTAQRIKSAKDLAKTPKPPEEGTYDKDTGKWTYKKDASAPIEEGYESDLYPDMIQALDQITGANEAQAKVASANFKKQLGVYVGKGQTEPTTYDKWWEMVRIEADGTAATKGSPTPDELRAAAKKLQTDQDVSFYVLYPKGAEKLPVEADETKRNETAKEAGKYVINQMIEDAKGKKGVEANYSFGALTEFYMLLRKAETEDPGRVPILTSLVSSAARNCMNTRPDLFADATAKDFDQRLVLNTNYYNNPDVDPVRHTVDTLLKPYDGREINLASLTANFNPHELVAFAISLRNIVDHKNYVLRDLDRLPPKAMSNDSITILKTLANSDNLPKFRNAMLNALGINPGFIESRLPEFMKKDITSGIEAFLKSNDTDDYQSADILLPSKEHKNGFESLIHYDKSLAGKYAATGMELGGDILQDNYNKLLVLSLAMMLIQPSLAGGIEEKNQSQGE